MEKLEEVAENIEEMCNKEELYDLSLEDLSYVLQHAKKLEFKTAISFVKNAAKKFGTETVRLLSSIDVVDTLKEIEIETLLSHIPGIPIFELLGNCTKKIEVDYENALKEEHQLRIKLEKIIEETNENKLNKELEKIKLFNQTSLNALSQVSLINGVLYCREKTDELEKCFSNLNSVDNTISMARKYMNEYQKRIDEANSCIAANNSIIEYCSKCQKAFYQHNIYGWTKHGQF